MPKPQIALRLPPNPRVRAALEAFATVADDLSRADGLALNSNLTLDRAAIAAAPSLRAVATASVGYDNVDIDALRERGIAFANSRGSLTDAVADLGHALVVMGLRRLPQASAWARDGAWVNAPAPFGTDVAGKTLGIVGFGDIGAAIAVRATAAKMRIVYHNRRPREDGAGGAVYSSFDDLLAQSDVVLALVPLSAATTGMFGRDAFARMKPGAMFVNIARGAVCDTDALLAALASGHLGSAALDVTDPEPLPAGHALYGLPNVIVTPHIGSATHETRERMSLVAIENLRAHFAGETMPTRVV